MILRMRVTTSPDQAYEWQSEALRFLIGRADSCALRFGGDAASFVSWEHAEVTYGPDGLPCLTDLGSTNGTYVDGVRIQPSAQTPIRVGSRVQIGRAGPVMEVLDVARGLPTPDPALAVRMVVAGRPIQVAATGEHRDRTPSSNVARVKWWRHPAVVCGAIALAVAVSYAVSRTAQAPAEPETKETPVAAAASGAKVIEDSQPIGASQPLAAQVQPVKPPPSLPPAAVEAAPADPWKAVLKDVSRNLRLLVVEDPKTNAAWPFAGATIVGERVLLTTATVAVEISTKFLSRGWRLTVMEGAQSNRAAVKELRVHAAFQQVSESEQLYFDMALVYLEQPAGRPIPMASAVELAELEKGLPLACIAVDHAGDPLDRFQEFSPQAYPGKIFALTSLPPQPGGPLLLHIRGSFTDKAAGSPIVNLQGHLIALYCEPAQGPDAAKGTLSMHYAKAIQPALIEIGLKQPDNKIWVPIKPTSSPPVNREHAK